jgi:hypothetical protein
LLDKKASSMMLASAAYRCHQMVSVHLWRGDLLLLWLRRMQASATSGPVLRVMQQQQRLDKHHLEQQHQLAAAFQQRWSG